MDIYIVRHAVAVPRGGDALDHARPLTPKGRARFEKEVRGLYRADVRFGRVYHSPWVRAVQTAELLKPLTTGERIETEDLARAPGPALLKMLEGDSVAVVGHEPWLGELLALLLIGDPTRGHLFPFKKGGVAHAEGDPVAGGCRLLGLYSARPLRMLA